jgi:PAS domain S-box-containing protein
VDDAADEIRRLRSCINDLISVLALPALWSGSESSQVAGTLLDVLLGMLRLDFACVRLSDSSDGPPIRVVRWGHRQDPSVPPRHVLQALDRWLTGDHTASRFVVRDPAGDSEVAIASFSLGLQHEVGVLAVGSRRHDFPTEVERLLLRVAANQAAIGLQEALRAGEQKRIAEALERRVAERTRQLTAVNEDLRRSQAYLAEAQRLNHTGSFGWRISTGEITWSEETFRIFQYDRATTPTVERVLQRVHPDDAPLVRQTIERASQDGEDFDHEYRLVMPDGSVKHVQVMAHAMSDESGGIEFAGAVIDLTAAKKAEMLLGGEKRLLEMIARGDALAPILQGICTLVEELVGGSLSSILLLDRNANRLRHGAAPSLPIPYREAIDGLVIGPGVGSCGTAAYLAEPVIVPDIATDPLWADYRGLALAHGLRACWSTPILSSARRVLGTFAIYYRAPRSPTPQEHNLIAQITHLASIAVEREQAEEARLRLGAIVASSDDAIIGKTLDGVITSWNAGAQRIFGYTAEEAVGRRIDMLIPADRQDEESLIIDSLTRGESVPPFETVRLRKDAREIHVSLAISPIRNPAGQVIGASKIARDITQRRRAEHALRQAQTELAHVARVTNLGEMAASIAHEVDQPLSGVVINANACLRFLAGASPNLDEVRDGLQAIARDGRRASEVTARIRTLARRTPSAKQPLDINAVVGEVVALAEGEARRTRTRVRTELAADLPRVLGDPILLQQVVLNLLLNGLDAMNAVDDRPREMVIRTDKEGADRVRVAVQDAGPGIDPAQARRMFDAFYTTKRGGLGMGLSISRTIVEQHGGRLWATPNEGPGTTFYFTV